ncbi:hypothetical protein [Mycetocola sp. JXN-3]|uniref:hypothetical protein n=1 Tax=Mycetocola sp. JXN-3 TaxID=2116510 RepID=UPI00165D1238|nr:hypothetical protein [Mycetocola sp. JXN-3]
MTEKLPAKRPPVIVLDPLEIVSRLLAGALYVFAVLAIVTWTKGLGPLYEFTGGNLDGLRGWTVTYGVAMALLAATLLIPVPGGRMLVSPLALVVVGAGCIVFLMVFGNPGPLTAYSSEWWGALLFNSVFVLYPVLAVLGFIRSVIPHRVTRRVLACVLLALGPVTIVTLALLTVSTS